MGGPPRFACRCGQVTRRKVAALVRRGAVSLEALGEACGAGISCRSCHPTLRALIERHRPAADPPPPRQLVLFDPDGPGR